MCTGFVANMDERARLRVTRGSATVIDVGSLARAPNKSKGSVKSRRKAAGEPQIPTARKSFSAEIAEFRAV